jgi:uncharacterized protein (DUF1778 family)
MPTSTRGRKTDRIEARLSAEAKEIIARAAVSQGLSVSDFVVRSASEAAKRVLQEQQVIRLSARDSQAFVEALDNPPEPNEKLRAAMAEYLRLYGSTE